MQDPCSAGGGGYGNPPCNCSIYPQCCIAMGLHQYYHISAPGIPWPPSLPLTISATVPADVRAEIATLLGIATDQVRLRYYAFMSQDGPQIAPTTGKTLSGTGILSWRTRVNGQVSLRVCRSEGGGPLTRFFAAQGIEEDKTTLVPTTLGSMRFVIALHENLSALDAQAYLDVQSTFFLAAEAIAYPMLGTSTTD